MKFYRLDEVPVDRADRVFGVSPVGKGIGAIVCCGIAAGMIYCAIIGKGPVAAITGGRPGDVPAIVLWFAGVFAGMTGLMLLKMARSSLSPTGWLMRGDGRGVIVKFSSYLHHNLGYQGPEAVRFEFKEIASAKVVKERRRVTSPDGKNRMTVWRKYLELGLVNPDASELERAIVEERGHCPQHKVVVRDVPVETGEGGTVQIRWGGDIKPSAREAVRYLGHWIKTLEPEYRRIDVIGDVKPVHLGFDPAL